MSGDESKMSGPFGDISNSWRYNDLPFCNSTYIVYTFNYGRETAMAFENWSHKTFTEQPKLCISKQKLGTEL